MNKCFRSAGVWVTVAMGFISFAGDAYAHVKIPTAKSTNEKHSAADAKLNRRIASVTTLVKNLKGLDSHAFTREQTKIAFRIGRILRDLGVPTPTGANEATLGFRLIRERNELLASLVNKEELTVAARERLWPLMKQLEEVRPLRAFVRPHTMEARIAQAARQLEQTISLEGMEKSRLITVARERIGYILRDLGVPLDEGESERVIGRKLLRQGRQIVVERLRQTGASDEDLATIMSQLAPIWMAMGRMPALRPQVTFKALDDDIAYTAKLLAEFHALARTEQILWRPKIAERLGRIIGVLGFEMAPGHVRKTGRKVLNERGPSLAKRAQNGQVNREDLLRLRPIFLALAKFPAETSKAPVQKSITKERIAELSAVISAMPPPARTSAKHRAAWTRLAAELGKLMVEYGVTSGRPTRLGRRLLEEGEPLLGNYLAMGQLSLQSALALTRILDDVANPPKTGQPQ